MTSGTIRRGSRIGDGAEREQCRNSRQMPDLPSPLWFCGRESAARECLLGITAAGAAMGGCRRLGTALGKTAPRAWRRERNDDGDDTNCACLAIPALKTHVVECWTQDPSYRFCQYLARVYACRAFLGRRQQAGRSRAGQNKERIRQRPQLFSSAQDRLPPSELPSSGERGSLGSNAPNPGPPQASI